MTSKYVLHLQKSVDRSWKYFYTVLKSAAIYLYKDKRTAAEVSFSMFLFLKQFITLKQNLIYANDTSMYFTNLNFSNPWHGKRPRFVWMIARLKLQMIIPKENVFSDLKLLLDPNAYFRYGIIEKERRIEHKW